MNTLFTKSIYLSLFFFLGFFVNTQAQAPFISFKMVKNTELNQLDFTVENFQDVYGFQFGIEMNDLDLEYTSILAKEPLETSSVQGNQIDNNILLSWFSSSATPMTIDGGTNIFSIAFNGDISKVEFCSSNEEIDFEGVIDLNGVETAVDIFFLNDCQNVNPCVLACNDLVMISIPDSGFTFNQTGMADMFIEGNSCDDSNLFLSIYDNLNDLENDNPLQDLSFGEADDDRELFYQITNLDNSESCWGKIILEYKITAKINAPADKEATCGTDISVDGISDTGRPLYYVIQDNHPLGIYGDEDHVEELGKYNDIEGPMTNLNVYVTDDYDDLDNCGKGILKRVFHLTDENGFIQSRAIQDININASQTAEDIQITWPQDLTVECNSGLDLTGQPAFEESPCYLLASTYEDQVIPTDQGSKIIRNWTIINWCDGTVFEAIQVITKICDSEDEAQPIVLKLSKSNTQGKLDFVVEKFNNALGFQFGVEFNSNDLSLTDVVLSNHLSPGSLQENQIDNNVVLSWININLMPRTVSEGEVLFSLQFNQDLSNLDFCGSEKEIEFEGVVDVNGQYTEVQLILNDNCSQNDFISAPDASEGRCGDEIPVEGITDEGAKLFYVVNDASPMGSFGVEDDLEELGFYNNIEVDPTDKNVYVFDDKSNLSDCGTGIIKRYFYLQDADGSPLGYDIQELNLSSGFGTSQISWPSQELTVECGAGLDVTGEPQVEENDCVSIAVTYEDEVFNGGIKIIREWTVLDWCSGDVSTFTQIINTDCEQESDETAPIAVCYSDLIVSIENEDVKLWAQDIDAGSSDNIGIVSYEIKRQDDSDYSEFINLSIEDEGELFVSLKVTDAAGNFNECFTTVIVSIIDVNPCVLTCNAEVLISMEPGQTFIINNALNLDIFLESDPAACENANFVINLFDANGEDISTTIFNEEDDGFIGSYSVTDLITGNSCWGTFSIEIKADALVWPGDTNNDGLVNNFDVLNIGISFDSNGPERENASTSWTGQNAANWNEQFSNGLNYKFADANGSGMVGYEDVEVVNKNWGEEHENDSDLSERTITGNDIPLFLEAGTYITNQMLEIPIHLGSTALPADDIYGVAFDLIYNNQMVLPESVSISNTQSWLATDNTNTLTVQKNVPTEGKIHYVLVRNDQQNKNGIGEIAKLNIQFNEINSEFEEAGLQIENIILIDVQGNQLPVVDINSMIMVQNTPTAINNLNPVNVAVYPNPTNGLVNIRTKALINNIKVISSNGNLAKVIHGNFKQLDLSDLQGQIYMLQIETENEVIMKKVKLVKF